MIVICTENLNAENFFSQTLDPDKAIPDAVQDNIRMGLMKQQLLNRRSQAMANMKQDIKEIHEVITLCLNPSSKFLYHENCQFLRVLGEVVWIRPHRSGADDFLLHFLGEEFQGHNFTTQGLKGAIEAWRGFYFNSSNIFFNEVKTFKLYALLFDVTLTSITNIQDFQRLDSFRVPSIYQEFDPKKSGLLDFFGPICWEQRSYQSQLGRFCGTRAAGFEKCDSEAASGSFNKTERKQS